MLDHKSFPEKKSDAANRSKIGVAHKGEDICFQGKFSNRSQSFRPHAEGGIWYCYPCLKLRTVINTDTEANDLVLACMCMHVRTHAHTHTHTQIRLS